jgi:DNA-binding LacI/PurR family transcriptional regulator
MIGIGVLRAAAERNIRVPSELSVIGFDDIQMSRYVYPALTTVGQSILQLGEMAAEVLLRRIATRVWHRSTDRDAQYRLARIDRAAVRRVHRIPLKRIDE